jgi:hypothetical protein
MRKRRLTMSEQAGMPGEPIYDHILQIKQVTEYGVALDTLLSGAGRPPAEGARFDLHVEGTANGPKLKGAVKGVDYINVRADGRLQLHFHAEITTEDGKKIALFTDGVATSDAGITGRSTPVERDAYDVRRRVLLGEPDPVLGTGNRRFRER